jgi:mandelate racemase
MVDFNQGLSLGDALHRCHALDDQSLYWLEEPIAYDNIAGYSQLTRELKTPIQLGENFYGPRALFQAVQAGAGKYMMPDLMRIGGVTGWLRAAAIAGAAGIEMSTHLYPEVWADPILAETFKLEAGHLIIPDRPGSGIAWNEEAIKRHQLDA